MGSERLLTKAFFASDPTEIVRGLLQLEAERQVGAVLSRSLRTTLQPRVWNVFRDKQLLGIARER